MLKSILVGIVIGIANIIPGVSGGTMAVAMGVYDKIIHAVTHLFKEFKESMKLLIPIVVGAALAIVAVARVIEFAFAKAPIQTNLFFIGLILGGLPIMTSRVKGNKLHASHIIAFILFFVVVIAFAAMGETDGNNVDLVFSVVEALKLFGVGVIAAATMVIPGVSGSMMLMLMGYYNPILSLINDFVNHLVAFDISAMLNDCLFLVPFGIGVVLGIGLIAKIIEWLFAKFPMQTAWAIIGLIVASPVAIILMNDFSGLNVVSIITGLIMLVIGVVISRKLGGE